ncbi:asparagine synthase-related protein [Micromonospora sp. NPDC047074]|uniref:asparagine synthase-related protein n=1 Tax=Micromonospora sp. NPDC047074 TaxID=3154339 RepID=UPI0033F89AD8
MIQTEPATITRAAESLLLTTTRQGNSKVDLDRVGQFVVLLPDSAAAAGVEERLRGIGDVRLHHSSGRPWLIAKTGTDPLIHEAAGQCAVALLGPASANHLGLRQLLPLAEDPDGLVRAGSRFDGSFVLFANTPGGLVARGPVSQTRRVFTARVNGVHLVSDRADVLAYLGDTRLETSRTRLHLAMGLPAPLNDLPVWAGVESVPGHRYVAVTSDGSSLRQPVWWTRPTPTGSRREGAERLRAALAAAVAVRTSGGQTVVADLSGGLDSTPVCYFAAQGPVGCVANTLYADQIGGGEDLLWAKKAIASMPGVTQHVVSSTADLPEFFGGLEVSIFPDEPTQAAAATPRFLEMLKREQQIGASIHLTGVGGDHLLRGLPMWEKAVFRANPRLAWRRVRDWPLLENQGALSLLRDLLDRRSYGEWYAAAVKHADDAVRLAQLPIPRINDWSVPIQLIPWLTKDARESIIDDLKGLTDILIPLGDTASEHFDLYMVQEAGKVARGMHHIGELAGVRVDAPLLDDHVVEAVLGVAYQERDSPLEWKPLMKAAMSGLLPEDYLARTSKVGGGPQAVRGFKNNYPSLMKIWEEAGLFDHGLIDRDRFFRDVPPDSMREPSRFVLALTNTALFLRARSRNAATR